MFSFRKESFFCSFEGSVDGLHQSIDTGVGSFGQIVMFDGPEDRFNVVEFGIVGRQVVQHNSLLSQSPTGLLYNLGPMEGGVIHNHHS